MGLKLLAALLPIVIPRDAREHVMGDLIERASAKDSNGFERGLRLRDVVNVLPRVWFAHVRRAWFGPVPSLAQASQAQIRARAEQFAVHRRTSWVALYALMFFEAFYKVPLRALRWLGDTPVLLLLGSATVIGFIMAMASLRRSRRNAPTSRQGWAEHHSQQLQVSIQRCHVWYGFLIPFLLTSEWRVSVLNAVLFTALNLYRLPRLRRELALLSHATEPLP